MDSGGGWYSYRPGGWGPGPGRIFEVLLVLIVVVIIAKLLDVAF